jgi:hypothetical protein
MRFHHLSKAITDHSMNVALAGDIMFVSKKALFVKISRQIKCETVEAIP